MRLPICGRSFTFQEGAAFPHIKRGSDAEPTNTNALSDVQKGTVNSPH
jgi:hypothetical protein